MCSLRVWLPLEQGRVTGTVRVGVRVRVGGSVSGSGSTGMGLALGLVFKLVRWYHATEGGELCGQCYARGVQGYARTGHLRLRWGVHRASQTHPRRLARRGHRRPSPAGAGSDSGSDFGSDSDFGFRLGLRRRLLLRVGLGHAVRVGVRSGSE